MADLYTAAFADSDNRPALLRYNGFDWTNYTYTKSIRVIPEPDSSGRTTRTNRYSFSFVSVFQPPAGFNTVALTAVAARRALTTTGAAFAYTGRGLGDFTINLGASRDVAWGPWPKELSLRPYGSGKALKLEWTLEVVVPDCSQARWRGISEYSYEALWDVDRGGWTKRTIDGHVRVALNRNSRETADDYREQVVPKGIEGFRRTPGTYRLSADRTTLYFSFTDEEMPENVPPPGVVDVQADYTLSTSGAAGGAGPAVWFATLNATYEVAKNGNRADAVNHFVKKLFPFYRKASGEAMDPGSVAIPLSFTAREPSIYGRPVVSFSVAWRFVGKITDVLKKGGLWQPAPDSNWRRWAGKMTGVLGPRGVAGMEFEMDPIVSLCSPGKPTVPASVRQERSLRNRPASPLEFDPPNADNSWLDYQVWLETEEDTGTVELRTLPENVLDPAPPKFELRAGAGAAPARNPFTGKAADEGMLPFRPQAIPRKDAPDANVQRRAAPLVVVYLCGKARRLGFPIPRPELTAVNGEKPILSNRLDRGEGFKMKEVNTIAGPVFVAAWRDRYILKRVPDGGLVPPANPVLGGKKK